MGNDWHDGEWVPNFYCEINVINRNADGNIESIVKSLPPSPPGASLGPLGLYSLSGI